MDATVKSLGPEFRFPGRALSAIKLSVRYLWLFCGALIAGVFLHEIGHAAVGWMEVIPAVPTPAKEYVLQSQSVWGQEIWIDLGGVAGTTVAAFAAPLHFWRKPCLENEAILVGAFVPPGIYSVRFFLIGPGHDDVEWQAAQTALGLVPSGHAIEVFFLCVLIVGFVAWIFRLCPPVVMVEDRNDGDRRGRPAGRALTWQQCCL